MNSFDVAIIGPYLLHNFGDDLIGAVLARQLAKKHGLRSCIPGLSFANAEWLGCKFSGSVWRTLVRARSVVVGGGGILGDSGRVPKTKYLWRGVRAATFARLTGMPVVVTGVGAGPLKLPRSRRLCRTLCTLAKGVGVRDDESLSFLTETLGVPRKKIVLGADVALLWPGLLDVTPAPSGRVGVQCDATGFASDDAKGIVDVLHRKLAEYCSAHSDECVLVSNHSQDTSLMQYLPRKVSSLNYSKLQDFLPRLAGLKSIITTHLHLSIAAYAARVPCFSLFVREKTARFYRQIGRADRAVSIETATPEDIDRLIREAQTAVWTDEDERRRESLCTEATKLLDVMDAVARRKVASPA